MAVCRVSRLAVAIAGAVLFLAAVPGEVRAQAVPNGAYSGSYKVSDYTLAPGLYGTSWGFASYGMPQTYSVFSSMPGPSYGTNYPPYGLMPSRYGVGLWRPGYVAPGYVYGVSYYPTSNAYRTFPMTNGTGRTTNQLAPAPGMGVYAPALGPGTLYGW